ncbi:MAG: helix-turn-helix transcriptional regulator [Devosia sp.]|nr:helix-turn-helix transcriptional regulator [Devosia sp.]
MQPILLDTGGAAQPGEGSVLLLVTDLELPLERDAVGALQLLGLSPAEARIADLVGSGHPPKEAARRLGNTEGTVRFSLNQIYRKLGISRQSELARLVARIQATGI